MKMAKAVLFIVVTFFSAVNHVNGASLLVSDGTVLDSNGGFIPNGLLYGLQGLRVGNTIYDVTFKDTSCSLAFDGCDELSDFDFPIPTPADFRAPLAEAIIDSGLGNFDTDPSKIFGCPTAAECQYLIPRGINLSGQVSFFVLRNTVLLGDSSALGFLGLPSTDTRTFNEFTVDSVFADFEQVAIVPIPAAAPLFGSVLLGSLLLLRFRARS